MKLTFGVIMASFVLPVCLNAQYHIVKTLPIKSDGKWDYIALCPTNNNVYVSHGTQVNILDRTSGDSIGVINNTIGVHGIAFAGNKGYISNGKLNTVTVFDLNTNKELAQIKTGDNPDAIMYEPFSRTILTCNGHSKDVSVIDPVSSKMIHIVALGGKPETAVSDNKGNVYINLEDKNEIVVLDVKHFMVKERWSLDKGEGPTGLAIDTKTKRLFAGCDGQLYIVNADNGKIVDHLPIGDGCDGVVFDPGTKMIFTSNAVGNVSIIEEQGADKYSLKETATTERGARTLAIDEKTHLVYLPSAQLEAAKPAENGVKPTRPGMVTGTFHVLVLGQ